MVGEPAAVGWLVLSPPIGESVIDDLPAANEPSEPEPPEEGRKKKGRLRAEGEAKLEQARASLAQRRPTSHVVNTAFLVAERNKALPAPVLVGALASRIVIYVIPFMVLMVFAVSVYADLATTSAEEAARNAGMAGLFAQVAGDATETDNGVRVAALIGTAFAVLWAANSLANLLRRIYALVWGIPLSRPGHWWALPLAVILTSIGSLTLSAIALESRDWPLTITAGEAVLEIALIGLLWLLVSRALPHDPEARRWRDFVPGSLLFAAGIVGMKVAMVVYFAPRAVTLSERYGSVSTAVVLLTWAYWVGFIVVASADLNAAVFRSTQRHSGGETNAVTPQQ